MASDTANGKATDEQKTGNWLTSGLRILFSCVVGVAKLAVLYLCCLWAYRIRLHGVKTFGYIVHGFDPTFNFHAARYMAKHGWYDFFRWYDYQSWYPIGRPVGTTIYPGMQIMSVEIWKAMKMIPKFTWDIPSEILSYVPKYALEFIPGKGSFAFGPMSLNNVCVMTGAWMGIVATFFTALLTAETSESTGAGVVAAFVMAGNPAHLMRSMAGEFDNESFAIATFMATFWLWCRSIRTPSSWPWAFLAAAAYVTAVATWGGYIFVNNLIGLHAAVLVALGKYNTGVYRAYSIWYFFGTAGATFVPVVGLTPLKSLEQMPSMAVFVGFQLIELCDVYRRRQKTEMSGKRFFIFRVVVFVLAGLAVAAGCFVLFQYNYFSPLSSRIRGIFLKHERTGNPLVDSVAEHQPSSASSYKAYLGSSKDFAFFGLFLCWHQRTPAKVFPVLFAIVAYSFSLKMNRLIIICGPIASILAGYPIGIVFDWCVEQVARFVCGPQPEKEHKPLPQRTGGMGSIWRYLESFLFPNEVKYAVKLKDQFAKRAPFIDRPLRILIAGAIAYSSFHWLKDHRKKYIQFCEERAEGFSSPGIVYEANLRDGTSIIVDDQLKGYQWLKSNTPADARVLAWWDYGYQITGIGNRTSLADGNTWNHEHIATIGRILSGAEKKSHNIMRHLADYALVHAGHQETDLRISTHFARIGSSVFPDICGTDDPTCRKYGFQHNGEPSKMMADSFVYKAVKHEEKPGVALNPKLFREVHKTKYGMIRIFKILNVSEESKQWVANPENRKCDAPGSWYCVGQYPPALDKLIAKRKNFAQLEDFNKKNAEKSAYTMYIEEKQKKGQEEL
eukprot:TRINITY_DN37256_c0_g1_i1.p1 TRINITY_DN37256_c0_g1~~TRINITY_DN37256_c0_g1_i1.p1  ORF type:complete len:841 (+),score=119.70 TRINITY_DN37256_c0_g1_i1:37-2559(+)